MMSPNWNQNQDQLRPLGYGFDDSRAGFQSRAGGGQGQNTGRRMGWSGPGGMVNPPTQRQAVPSAPPPQAARNTGGMMPFNPVMSPQDYFRGVPPWGGNQSQLSIQNPMMSMWSGQQGQNRGTGMQPSIQPVQGYGRQPTSNPFMPQMQQPQPQPQQMPANAWNPFQSSQGWNQSGQFPGFRFPAY